MLLLKMRLSLEPGIHTTHIGIDETISLFVTRLTLPLAIGAIQRFELTYNMSCQSDIYLSLFDVEIIEDIDNADIEGHGYRLVEDLPQSVEEMKAELSRCSSDMF